MHTYLLCLEKKVWHTYFISTKNSFVGKVWKVYSSILYQKIWHTYFPSYTKIFGIRAHHFHIKNFGHTLSPSLQWKILAYVLFTFTSKEFDIRTLHFYIKKSFGIRTHHFHNKYFWHTFPIKSDWMCVENFSYESDKYVCQILLM